MKLERLMEQLIGVFALLILIGGTVLVIAPFFTALLWGAILAYCTWRPFQRLTKAFGGRRTGATLLVVLLILFVVFGPALYGGIALSAKGPEYVARLQELIRSDLYALPGWISSIPFVGPRIQEGWDGVVSQNPEAVARLRELAAPVFGAAIAAGVAIVRGLGMLLLSVLFAAAFYIGGETAATNLHAVMRHIAGGRADELLGLIGATVKGVVYGILGTSLVQALLCSVAYLIAGLPSVALLGLITFFLSIIPGGPLLVVVPGVIWLVRTGHVPLAIFLAVWAFSVAIIVDNVLKPILIGKSSHVPFILVMLGVLGGAVAFGLLGVFVGPTLLAVAHAVLKDWTKDVVEERAIGPAPISAVSTGEARLKR